MAGKKDKSREESGSKEKQEPKRPASKSKESIAPPVSKQPSPKAISQLQQQQVQTVPKKQKKRRESPESKKEEPPNDLDDRSPFTLFGPDLPLPDNETASMVERGRRLDDVFTVGGILQNTSNRKKHNYLLEEKLGPTEFAVSETRTGLHYFLKIEASGMPRTGPKMKRFVKLLLHAKKIDPVFRTHFLELVDTGLQSGDYNFIVTQLGGKNLADLRVVGPPLGLGQPDQQFYRGTAYQLCVQTLQAIHDVHLCRFVHRDIQPKNFVVGLGSGAKTVYIVGFSLADKYYSKKEQSGSKKNHGRLAKLPWLDHTFQSRSFHSGDKICRQHDLESWLYMCYFLFNSFCLPWKFFKEPLHEERQIYNFKCLLFTGVFDELIEPYVPLSVMNTVRHMVYRDCEKLRDSINYSAYGEVFFSVRNTLPRQFQWDDPFRFQVPKKENAVPGSTPNEVLKAATQGVSQAIKAAPPTTNTCVNKSGVQGISSGAKYVVSGEKGAKKPVPSGFIVDPRRNTLQAIRVGEIATRSRMDVDKTIDSGSSSSDDDDSKQDAVNPNSADRPPDKQ